MDVVVGSIVENPNSSIFQGAVFQHSWDIPILIQSKDGRENGCHRPSAEIVTDF
jgi:hypothetical protein